MGSGIPLALLLTFLAGAATALGGLLGLLFREPGPRFLSATLGFSAGVMIQVSFVELLSSGIESAGFLGAHVGFFAGMMSMYLVDSLVPHRYFAEERGITQGSGLHRVGLLTALGIAIHNFPEGMATFAGALQDLRLGLAIAVAVAVHNVPEGLAVSTPVYMATGSQRKALLWSLYSGLAEPAGAVLAAAFLYRFLDESVLGWLLSGVAGVMVYISLDELIPASRGYGRDDHAILGAVAGMMVMTLYPEKQRFGCFG